jgi:hypothetical protein
MKYTLTCEQGSFKNTTEFEEDFLPSVLENMQLFLRGCGFYFDGTLDIINEETEELYSDTHDFRGMDWNETVKVNPKQMDMFDSMDVQHSSHYFDTERNK